MSERPETAAHCVDILGGVEHKRRLREHAGDGEGAEEGSRKECGVHDV